MPVRRKRSIAALVLLTTAKVFQRTLNSDTDRAMIDDFLRKKRRLRDELADRCQYAGALRHTGCTLSNLQRTTDYLTGWCAPLGRCARLAVCAREKSCAVPPARF